MFINSFLCVVNIEKILEFCCNDNLDLLYKLLSPEKELKMVNKIFISKITFVKKFNQYKKVNEERKKQNEERKKQNEERKADWYLITNNSVSIIIIAICF